MKTLWGFFLTITIVVLFLTLASNLATEVGNKNSILDDNSVNLIIELNYEASQFNSSNLEETQSSLTNDSTFEGVDAFARQYLEDKSEITQKKTTLEKVFGVPDLVITAVGIENNALIISIKILLISLLSFALGLALYKAIRTGETG
jgi:hypothetical protein